MARGAGTGNQNPTGNAMPTQQSQPQWQPHNIADLLNGPQRATLPQGWQPHSTADIIAPYRNQPIVPQQGAVATSKPAPVQPQVPQNNPMQPTSLYGGLQDQSMVGQPGLGNAVPNELQRLRGV